MISTLAPIASRFAVVPSNFNATNRFAVGSSFFKNRTLGPLRFMIQRSTRPSRSQSVSASPRPSSGKSSPLNAEMSAKRLPAPVLRKTQWRSRPLNERPARISLLVAAQPTS